MVNGWALSNIAAAAKSLQSCLTLCDPRDGSPPGSPVPGIFQARVLEWGAIAITELSNQLLPEEEFQIHKYPITKFTAIFQHTLRPCFSPVKPNVRRSHWHPTPVLLPGKS